MTPSNTSDGKRDKTLLNAGMRHHSVMCRCGCGAVITTDLFDWDNAEDMEMWIDFALAYHGSLRERLKAAWRVIRGREPWLHSVEIQRPEAEVLIEALQRVVIR